MVKKESLLTHVCCLALAIVAGQAATAADSPAEVRPQRAVELGAPFADHAILQRGMKVPVWGWSKPGSRVTVSFGRQTKVAVAGKDGKWTVDLDPLEASFEPAEMTVTEATGAKVVVTNILVGEVWLASGQSNMNRPVLKTDCSRLGPPPKAELAPIREFNPDSPPALHPIERAGGAWSSEWMQLNAISYSFARKLLEELDVPIGILHVAVGETSIRAWTPRCGFAGGDDEYTRAIERRLRETDPATPEHKQAWDEFYKGIEDALARNAALVARGAEAIRIPSQPPGNLRSTRDDTWMFNGKMHPVVPYAIRGALWNQGWHSIDDGIDYYHNLHSMIRGWRREWGRPDLPVYFHQFYTPGDGEPLPSVSPMSEMRLGTWLARDIPDADMVTQIDIGGEVHYKSKALPGLRFANMALKRQYPSTTLAAGGKAKDLVVHGPMLESYNVDGDKVVVKFEHADGGLVVAETGTRGKSMEGFAEPTVIENGDDEVKLFYLAGEDRVWHPARMRIDGTTVVVTSPAVPKPRGISYATGGVAWQPNLYNRALLPTTPFISYDHELVTSRTWPDPALKIAGVEARPPQHADKKWQFRNLPLLGGQFRDHAVLQAGVPVTFWGAVRRNGLFQDEPEAGACQVVFEFGTLKKTIDVTPEMREWRVVVPPMEAGSGPHVLKVAFTQDGEVVHERTCTDIVYGDVIYVATPSRGRNPVGCPVPEEKNSGQIVRMMLNRSKRSFKEWPSRYTVSVSTKADTSVSSIWEDASGPPGAIGHAIAAARKRPVGVIFMETKGEPERIHPPLKDWIPPEFLSQVPGLREDHRQVMSVIPGNEVYDANARRYLADWKRYWSEYIPEMIATARVPRDAPWGAELPALSAGVTTTASTTWNVSTLSFTPGGLGAIVFLSYPALFADEKAADFGTELAAMANGWKAHFGEPDPCFIYTVPSPALVPSFAAPRGIAGKSRAVEVDRWDDLDEVIQAIIDHVQER